MKYAFIHSRVGGFKLRLMCRLLRVSSSGYYAWLKRGPSERSRRNDALLIEIRAAHSRSRRTYGSPRIFNELREQGFKVGENRVARLMREREIKAKTHRRFRVTTNSDHAHPIASNLLQRRFAPAEVKEANRVWTSDITYLWTREGWLYLAVVLDLSSRRVVGWSMQEKVGSSLAVSALEMALASRRRSKGVKLQHHSDRGIQYAASNYRDLLVANGIECSMSRKGNCWDNAVTESFFATLKKELVQDSDWKTRDEARSAVFDFIEVWYNRERKHSALGYVSPAEYERLMQKKAA